MDFGKKVNNKNVREEDVDLLLPQTQCQECTYQGCMPYAKAIIAGEDTIDKCKPGGVDTLNALANLLDLDPSLYLKKVIEDYKSESIVKIDYQSCIGCTKCIQACPVDAIVGAAKSMHAVLVDRCTGCDLCISSCPVDCIETVYVKPRDKEEKKHFSATARINYNEHKKRLDYIKDSRRKGYLDMKKRLLDCVE